MPDYFAALSQLSAASWKGGTLTRKERELIAIAIDCVVTHMFEPGLAMHIRCALQHGAPETKYWTSFSLRHCSAWRRTSKGRKRFLVLNFRVRQFLYGAVLVLAMKLSNVSA